MKKRSWTAALVAICLLAVLAAALPLAGLTRETVKFFGALPPEEVQAAMAARQAPVAYTRGLAALEAAGYGRTYSRLLLEPLTGLLALAALCLLGAAVLSIVLVRRAAKAEARQVDAFCRWLRHGDGNPPKTTLPTVLLETCAALRQEKQAQAEAHQQLLQELRRYHADVLHQINTPLAVLRLSLERQDAAADVAQVEKAAALVRDALELDRIGSGAVRLQFQEMPASEVVELAVNDLEPLAQARGVGLHVTGNATCIWCCDPFWMQEALENLLKNALEHSPAGSTVFLTYGQTSQENTLEILDRGPGFSQEMASSLFTRYASVRRQSSESHGLGLSIARALIRLHFGMLSVKNRPEGGAAFLIRFPRLEPGTIYGQSSR